MGVKIYNDFPIEHRQADSLSTFRKSVTEYSKV